MSNRNPTRVYWVNRYGDDMMLLRGNELMSTDYFGEVGSDQDWLDTAKKRLTTGYNMLNCLS